MTVPDATRAVCADGATAGLAPARLLRQRQVAELLGVTQSAVSRMARAGVLPGIRTLGRGRSGDRWRFRPADVAALLATYRPPGAPGTGTAGPSEWQRRHLLPFGAPTSARPLTTLTPLIDRYLTGRQARCEIGARTVTEFRCRLDSLARSFELRPLAELERRAVNAWQEETFAPLTPATRRGYLSTVKVFCRWLVDEGLVPVDPAAGAARGRQPRRVPRALPAGAVAQVIAAAGDDLRIRAVLLLMLQTGMRCVEVGNLDVRDYDREAGTVRVRGKFDNERVLPVPEEAAVAVDRYLAACGWTTGPLVRNRAGNSGLNARTLSVMISRLMAAAGIKRGRYDGTSAHALRHTAASDTLEASHDIRSVQSMLGHVHLSSTEIYLRATTLDQLRAAMAGRRYER